MKWWNRFIWWAMIIQQIGLKQLQKERYIEFRRTDLALKGPVTYSAILNIIKLGSLYIVQCSHAWFDWLWGFPKRISKRKFKMYVRFWLNVLESSRNNFNFGSLWQKLSFTSQPKTRVVLAAMLFHCIPPPCPGLPPSLRTDHHLWSRSRSRSQLRHQSPGDSWAELSITLRMGPASPASQEN